MYIALFLCFLAPTAWAVGDGTLYFITQPRDKIVRAGETVTLYCSVNNGGNGRFMWVRDDQVISQDYAITVAQDPHRYSIQGIDGNYNLRIVNSKAEDSGTYRCMVTAGGSGIMSTLGRLVVETPPAQEYPTCKSSESNEVAVGETITISCMVEGGNPAADLTILKNDVTMLADSILDGIKYTWTVVEEDEGAEFSCVGRQVFWTDPRTCRLGPYHVITEPPTALLVPRLMETIAGGAASFVCSATSAPRVHYRWFFDDNEVFHGSENDRFTIEHAGAASILQIHGVFENDSGRVLCYVEAATGTIFAEADLEVRPYVVVPDIPNELPETLPSTGLPVNSPDATDYMYQDYSEDAQPDPTAPKSASTETFMSSKLPIILGAVGACIVLIVIGMIVVVFLAKSYQSNHTEKDHQQVDPQDEDVIYRSRYVSVVRSWLFPVHRNTQASVAAFGIDNPSAANSS